MDSDMSSSAKIQSRWFLLVNPVAGGGRALLDYPLISKLLHDEKIQCEPHFTDHKFHAVELTVSAINQGYRKIIVLGGDGTLHEVVNGLYIQKCVEPKDVLLAVIGVGTGNDWMRTYGLKEGCYVDNIKAIKANKSILQDVGEVSYVESQYRQSRYMVGVGGAGFDAYNTKLYLHRSMKRRPSKLRHYICAIESYFRYKSTGVKIYIDDTLIYNDLLFSAAIGIGRYNGGGVQQLPEAIVDDGLFDMTIIRPFHFWHILFRFLYLFDGNIYRIGHTEQWRGEKIRIESTPEIMVEVDGELMGGTPLIFTLHPKAIRIIASEEFVSRNSNSVKE